MTEHYKKSGYLTGDFKIFYLTDHTKKEFDFHYHDFHKLLIFLGGKIHYAIEGREYTLCPGDIVLIRAGEIHRPIFMDSPSYKRIIIYVSDHFFRELQKEQCDLFYCYEEVLRQDSNLIRLSPSYQSKLQGVIHDLVESFSHPVSYTGFYQKIKFIEFLILLNKIITEEPSAFLTGKSIHPVILNILNYINEHLTDDLSVDIIANQVFLNRSYVMHLFKSETGCTIKKYITEKRLFLANRLISQGIRATEACYLSGFKNYTTFYQAYKEKYQHSPKELFRK